MYQIFQREERTKINKVSINYAKFIEIKNSVFVLMSLIWL